MTTRIAVGEREPREVELARSGEHAVLLVDGQPGLVTARAQGGALVLEAGDCRETAWCAAGRDSVFVHAFGRAWQLTVTDPAEVLSQAATGADTATAPMPGAVVSVAVQAGDQVTQGQVLAVIESMKMHSEITASRDGTVERVPLAAGDSFDQGAVLVVLAPAGDDGPTAPEPGTGA